MKRKSPVSALLPAPLARPSVSAFTLVELLVVIAIIVILMSLLLTAVPAVKKAAGKAEARNTCNMVVTALNAYYTEYAKFPPTDTAPPAPGTPPVDIVVGATSGVPNNVVFYTLRNIAKGPNEDFAANPRKVTFYEGKSAKASGATARNGFYDHDKGGGVPPGGVESCLFDPWGQQYGVVLDATGDDRIDLVGFYADFTGAADENGKAPRRKAGAFSTGEDEVLGSKDKAGYYRSANETSDDVVSWDQ